MCFTWSNDNGVHIVMGHLSTGHHSGHFGLMLILSRGITQGEVVGDVAGVGDNKGDGLTCRHHYLRRPEREVIVGVYLDDAVRIGCVCG